MKQLRPVLLCTLLVVCYSCSFAGHTGRQTNVISLEGSTPGDSIIKSILGIAQATPVDFIRWQLNLYARASADSFSLDISYGVSKPNTMGFMDDYGQKSYRGSYAIIDQDKAPISGRIYQLTSAAWKQSLSIVQLDEQVFHILRPGNRLINGNGGWSYTLNRSDKGVVNRDFTTVFSTATLFPDTATQATFDGRTPCNIAIDYKMGFTQECFKLKWRLILHRDGVDKESGTYSINRTLSRKQELTGKWELRKHPSNPSVNILQLDPDLPEKSAAFLVADNDVLFFLRKDYTLYTGNRDFSYTLNRKT